MRSNPEQVAWRILLTAFLIFLLLCSSAAYVVQWYLFQSTESMIVEINVSRGTAGVSPLNVEEALYVANYDILDALPASLRTDPNSQAVVNFTDKRGKVLVASIVLYGNARINVEDALAPRFGLNQAPYRIRITGVSGRAEILLFNNDSKRSQLEVTTLHSSAQLIEPGRYMVDASTAQTRFLTRTGYATFRSAQGQSLDVRENQSVTIDSTSNPVLASEADITLLENPFFAEDINIGWVQHHDAEPNEPVGDIYNATFAGRTVAVIDRSAQVYPDRQLRHGEDGIVQKFYSDVSEYSSVVIRATFFIEEQSLSRCGQQGSECPILLHVKWIDASGVSREFRQGFFAFDDLNIPYPERCITCSDLHDRHDRISIGSWFTYESGNLIQFPDENRPQIITQIGVSASGHAYKVYVSEINLIATR